MRVFSVLVTAAAAAVLFATASVSANATAAPQGYQSDQAAPADRREPPARPSNEGAGQEADRSGNVITDAWTTTKIHADFVDETVLEGSDIDVETEGSVVTLSGTVPTQAGRARAVEIARSIEGVTRVIDRMTIGPADVHPAEHAGEAAGRAGERVESAAESAGERVERGAEQTGTVITDGWLTTKVHADFIDEPLLEGSEIDVETDNRVVTLTGTVKSEAARARAVEIATKMDGVTRVVDKLTIR